MTDPMGKHWDQPSRFDIEIDATHAMMSQATCDALKDYSHSQPSGVYPGKMWKLNNERLQGSIQWWLRWFGHSEKGPEFCSNHARRIIIV